MEVPKMDKNNQKEKIKDKEIEKLTDEELEKVSGGVHYYYEELDKVSGGKIIPMLED